MIKDGFLIPSSFICAVNSGDYNRAPILPGTNDEEMKLWMTGFQGTPDDTPLVWALFDPDLTFDHVLPTQADKRLFEDIALHTSRMWTATHVDANARALSAQQDDVYAYQFNWGGEGERRKKTMILEDSVLVGTTIDYLGDLEGTDIMLKCF